jgi:hypothetical protein
MSELDDWQPITSVPTFDMEVTPYLTGASMQRQDDGSGEWVNVDDVRPLLQRIAELESQNRVLKSKIQSILDDDMEPEMEARIKDLENTVAALARRLKANGISTQVDGREAQ